MTFVEWQRALAPESAAREVRRRAETRMAPAQRSAALAVLLEESALAAGFAGAPEGALRGVPYLVKDLFDVGGLPTLAGSSFLAEVRPAPAGDSLCVGELRAAGAVLAGKTHLLSSPGA